MYEMICTDCGHIFPDCDLIAGKCPVCNSPDVCEHESDNDND